MKRFALTTVSAFVLLASSMLLCHPVQAQSTAEAVKRRGAVIIGFRDDALPFSAKSATGQATGYAIDICNGVAARIASDAGLTPPSIRYVKVPVDQIDRYVQGGTVDLLCSATADTPRRRQVMDFSPPIFIASLRVLVRTADQIRSVDQLAGKPVVVVGRTNAETRLSRPATGRGHSFTVSKAINPGAALAQLQLGWVAGYARYDALLAAQAAANAKPGEYVMLPESLASDPIGIAFRRGDAGLSNQVRAVMGEMHKAGELVELYQRWFLRPLPPNDLTLGIALPESLIVAWSSLR